MVEGGSYAMKKNMQGIVTLVSQLSRFTSTAFIGNFQKSSKPSNNTGLQTCHSSSKMNISWRSSTWDELQNLSSASKEW
jgi:hypothetical protein